MWCLGIHLQWHFRMLCRTDANVNDSAALTLQWHPTPLLLCSHYFKHLVGIYIYIAPGGYIYILLFLSQLYSHSLCHGSYLPCSEAWLFSPLMATVPISCCQSINHRYCLPLIEDDPRASVFVWCCRVVVEGCKWSKHGCALMGFYCSLFLVLPMSMVLMPSLLYSMTPNTPSALLPLFQPPAMHFSSPLTAVQPQPPLSFFLPHITPLASPPHDSVLKTGSPAMTTVPTSSCQSIIHQYCLPLV